MSNPLAERMAREAKERAQKVQQDATNKLPANTATNLNQKQLDNGPAKTGTIFYARVPHSKFIFSDCQEAFFSFGRLEVSPRMFPGTYACQNKDSPHFAHNGRPKWQVYEEELRAICPPNANNPNIYLPEVALPEDLPTKMNDGTDISKPVNAVSEVGLATADQNIMRGNLTRIEQETGAASGGAPSDPNVSSLDKGIQDAMFAAGTAASISK